MNDRFQFLRTLEDIREEQQAAQDRASDPDGALISDYVIGELSAEQEQEVRARIERDPAFRALAEPMLVAAEHARRKTPISPERLERGWLELRRRVGLPSLPVQPDPEGDRIRAEERAEKRINFRRAVWAAAAIVVMFAALPAIGALAGLRDKFYQRAPWGSTEVANLLGGSTATLSSGTRLVKHSDFGPGSRFVILAGEASFDIVPGTLAPLTVRTQSAEITVVGTRFTIHAYAYEPTAIAVTQGTVSVQGLNADGDPFGQPLSVSAGQRARAVRGYLPELVP